MEQELFGNGGDGGNGGQGGNSGGGNSFTIAEDLHRKTLLLVSQFHNHFNFTVGIDYGIGIGGRISLVTRIDVIDPHIVQMVRDVMDSVKLRAN